MGGTVKALLSHGAILPEDRFMSFVSSPNSVLKTHYVYPRARAFCCGIHFGARDGTESPLALLRGFPEISHFIFENSLHRCAQKGGVEFP